MLIQLRGVLGMKRRRAPESMPRKVLAVFFACMPVAVLFFVVIRDRSGDVVWLARNGRSVESFGEASIEAPVPFQGSLWSVWGTIPAAGERGGWQTAISIDDRPCDFVAKIGLHPDYYEIGRTDGVLISVEIVEDDHTTEIWSAMFSPGLKGRREPFRSVRVSLGQWQNKNITLRMKARPYGKNTVVVIWVEPRLEHVADEES
jgi:hypothetical protein